jgi:hypothetical protein
MAAMEPQKAGQDPPYGGCRGVGVPTMGEAHGICHPRPRDSLRRHVDYFSTKPLRFQSLFMILREHVIERSEDLLMLQSRSRSFPTLGITF